MECAITPQSVSKGIQDNAKNKLNYSGKFSEKDEIYTPVSPDYQEVIDDINKSFGEDIVVSISDFFTIAEPSEKLVNQYLSGSQQIVEPVGYKELSDEQDIEFKNLQKIGLISQDSHTVNGRTYYKIPEWQGGKNEEKKDRLEQIIHDRKIDFLHIIYASDNYLIEVGEKDEMPSSPEEPTQSSKASSLTKARVMKFLDAIGFRNIQTVNQLIYKGERLAGSAYVDFMNGVMQIVAGKEDYTLPEESMHILVELVKEARPELYQQMKKEIVNYKIYRDVLHSPAYQTKLYQKDGQIDYDKIKDEAIAKMLAEQLINSLEGTQESSNRIHQAYNWWKQIVLWIREFFGSKKNPFEKVLEELNQDDTTFGEFTDLSSDDIFLSAKSITDIDKENPETRQVMETIRNRPKEQNIEKIDDDYYHNGQLVPASQRVSELKRLHNEQMFRNKQFDDKEIARNEKAQKDGSLIHTIFEEVVNSWIDPVTGLMRRNPTSVNLPNHPFAMKISIEVQKYVKDMMVAYPTGTRFLTEQIIYDPNVINKDKSKGRFGTIDFQAIVPAVGNKPLHVDILDWKTMLLDDIEGVKDWKKEGIDIQLNEYKRIEKESYGIEHFGKIRGIPIHRVNKFFPSGESVLMGIEIGDADASKIDKENKRLRPIIASGESSGSEDKDKLIKELQSQYDKYVKKGYFQKGRNILDDLQEAIYEIYTANSVDNLSDYFEDLRVQFIKLLSEQNTLIQNGTPQDIDEALALITFYNDIAKNLVEPSRFLQEDITVEKASRTKLFEKASRVDYLNYKLNGMRKAIVDSGAKKENIFNLLLPEKVVNMAKRIFRSLGNQDVAALRYMYELVKKAYNRIDFSTDEKLKKLKDLKFNFDEWRKKNGKSSKDAIGMMINHERARPHLKIDRAFYEERDRVLSSRNAAEILTFIKKNYDLTAYDAWYKKTLEENMRMWEAADYDTDPVINAKKVKSKIAQFEKEKNIYTNPVTAFGSRNPLVWGKNIKEENWYSAEYKELLKKGNEPLLAMYDFMIDTNKELAETGAIRDYEAYTFFPNVNKTFADIMSFDDKNILAKSTDALIMRPLSNWRKSISVGDYQLNEQGEVDPKTGKPIQKRFIPYTHDIDNDYEIRVDVAVRLGIIDNSKDTKDFAKKVSEWRAQSEANNKAFADMITQSRNISYDIFTIYALLSKEVNKEKYLAETDEIIRALAIAEQTKVTYQQNRFGVIQKDQDGKPITSDILGRNAALVAKYARMFADGELLQFDEDFVVKFGLREKWNKLPLPKVFKFDLENYSPTNISASKAVMWLNTFNIRKTLGLSAGASISNLFGGSFSSSKLFQKYVSSEDINKAFFKMTGGDFYSTEEMKKNAALVDYFLPLLQNREVYKASQLSVNQAAKILSREWLMYPMRKSSEIVQLNIFLGLIENTGLIDGKIVNLRVKAAQDSGHDTRYAEGITSDKRKAIEKDFLAKLKEYKEKYSLVKTSTFKTIKEGGKDKVILEIPGVDRNSKEVEELREISQTMTKDSLGEADEFDVAPYRMNIYWRLMMTFKNWIPRMFDVRFGEFRHSQAHHAFEYGRLRMFARALSANWVQSVVKLFPVPYITGKITNATFSKDSLIERAKVVYKEKVEEAKFLNKYDNTFISEAEFIDRFIQGTNATFAEIRVLTLMMLVLFSGVAAPDDDDDASDKAYKALIRKQVNKLIDEVGFFYSPKSGIDIAGGGAPIFSIVRDTWYLGTNTFDQFFGFTLEETGIWEEKGQKMQESAKPIKRLFKILPVMKEILNYLPLVDEETAKDWGVKITDRRAF